MYQSCILAESRTHVNFHSCSKILILKGRGAGKGESEGKGEGGGKGEGKREIQKCILACNGCSKTHILLEILNKMCRTCAKKSKVYLA